MPLGLVLIDVLVHIEDVAELCEAHCQLSELDESQRVLS